MICIIETETHALTALVQTHNRLWHSEQLFIFSPQRNILVTERKRLMTKLAFSPREVSFDLQSVPNFPSTSCFSAFIIIIINFSFPIFSSFFQSSPLSLLYQCPTLTFLWSTTSVLLSLFLAPRSLCWSPFVSHTGD